VKRAGEWFTDLPEGSPASNEIGVRVLKEIRERLKFLVDVGPRLSLTSLARLGHAVRRRKPAHPARLADRLLV
jgi:excinuclease UvrABC ATPase subunit